MTGETGEKLLELTDVGLTLRDREILQRVCLQVDRGEILTIVGPNGAGKTTLLRVALGLQPPTSGRRYLQPDVRIGYMPQRLQLDATFPLSVRRFLSLAAPGPAASLADALEQVGAAHVFDAPLHSLSGGEMQRVLLARTLLRQPDLLVLDEPVQGVDVHGQVELYRLIARIRDERACAILMVSHDLHLVMAATDRVVCLNRHICCSGAPETVTADPAYLEMFGPLGVQNLAVYTHDSEHRHDCSEEHR
ncbi:MAG TPA: zinc ABC transporter ATP-binding protein ZnuC [Desulfuromonadales bacterium]|nr:zinc ABC transporter ATP-binding protein ZnuC [Desulfuromonadales bacterium]